jgi:hypothetical protein
MLLLTRLKSLESELAEVRRDLIDTKKAEVQIQYIV